MATPPANKLAAQAGAAAPVYSPGMGNDYTGAANTNPLGTGALPTQGMPAGFNQNLYNLLLGYNQAQQFPGIQVGELNALFGLDQGQYGVQSDYSKAMYGQQQGGLQDQMRRSYSTEAESLGMEQMQQKYLQDQAGQLPAQQAEAMRQQQGRYGASGNLYSGEQKAQTGIFKGQQELARRQMQDALNQNAMQQHQTKEQAAWQRTDLGRSEKELGLTQTYNQQNIAYDKSREALTHEAQLLQIAMQQAGIPAQVLQQYFPYLFMAGSGAMAGQTPTNPFLGTPYNYDMTNPAGAPGSPGGPYGPPNPFGPGGPSSGPVSPGQAAQNAVNDPNLQLVPSTGWNLGLPPEFFPGLFGP